MNEDPRIILRHVLREAPAITVREIFCRDDRAWSQSIPREEFMPAKEMELRELRNSSDTVRRAALE